MVAPVRDVEVAAIIQSDAGRPVQFAVSISRSTEDLKRLAIGIELLDSVVAPVGDEDIVV